MNVELVLLGNQIPPVDPIVVMVELGIVSITLKISLRKSLHIYEF